MSGIGAASVQPQFSGVFSQVYGVLDYMPIISTGKALADLFFSKCWRPLQPDQLPAYSREYFYHLSGKENIRYIAALPIFGNIFVIMQDLFASCVARQERVFFSAAENGDLAPLKRLYEVGSAESKVFVRQCCYHLILHPCAGTEKARKFLLKIVCGQTLFRIDTLEKQAVLDWFLQNIQNFDLREWNTIYQTSGAPSTLRHRIRELCLNALQSTDREAHSFILSNAIQEASRTDGLVNALIRDSEGRINAVASVVRQIQSAAEAGNNEAFDFLIGEFENPLSPIANLDIFSWLVIHAKDFTSPLNTLAWNTLTLEHRWGFHQPLFSAFLEMLEIPNLPLDRFASILSHLDYDIFLGTEEQKNQLLNVYLRLAATDPLPPTNLRVKLMHKIAKIYFELSDTVQAERWFILAGNLNYLPSILKLGLIYVSQENFEAANYWYEKALVQPRKPSQVAPFEALKNWVQMRQPASDSFIRSVRRKARLNDEKQTQRQTQTAEVQARCEVRESRYRLLASEWYPTETEQPSLAAEQLTQPERAVNALREIIGPFHSTGEMRAQWRRWSRIGHPDRGGDQGIFTLVTNVMQEIENRGYLPQG